jgi:hypothetical protein
MTTKSKKQRKTLIRQRALAVLSRMRYRNESLSKAARALHTTPQTVRKFVGKQLRRKRSGRYSVSKTDRLKREINVFGADGYEPVTVRSFTQAQLASEHLIAVNRFLRTGDMEWLKRFVASASAASNFSRTQSEYASLPRLTWSNSKDCIGTIVARRAGNDE